MTAVAQRNIGFYRSRNRSIIVEKSILKWLLENNEIFRVTIIESRSNPFLHVKCLLRKVHFPEKLLFLIKKNKLFPALKLKSADKFCLSTKFPHKSKSQKDNVRYINEQISIDFLLDISKKPSNRNYNLTPNIKLISLVIPKNLGFYESINCLDQTKIAIQMTFNGRRSTQFLGKFLTNSNPFKNWLKSKLRAIYFLKKTLLRIHLDNVNNIEINERDLIGQIERYSKEVNFYDVIKFFMRRLLQRLNKQSPKTNWRIGFSADLRKLNDPITRFETIQVGNSGFIADPFPYNYGGENYIFSEQVSSLESNGEIVVHKILENDYIFMGSVLKESFHLSFPFLFTFEDELYMCPETAEIGEIRIYRCEEFPRVWSLEKVLMNNCAAADSVIFEKNGLWWLLTNLDSIDSEDYSSELHAFYASSPLSNVWTPHSGNPLVIDSFVARNGGLFQEDGQVYRVGQHQDFGDYGKSYSIFRIDDIGQTTYIETEVLTSDMHLSGIMNTHHFSRNSRLSVFDFRVPVNQKNSN